jgi:quercetin dioxygenase-like cupin family protein
MKGFLALGAFFALLPSTTLAEESHESKGFNAQVVMKATRTTADQPVILPMTDKPEITAMFVTIEPGGHSNLHKHPVPTIVYILEGALEVHEGGVVRSHKVGEAVIEPMNSNMQAFNPGSVPTKLVVVQVGEEGKPNSIAAQDH